MCSYSLCSCSFEPEIIKIAQSCHKMYSNNILKFQESTTCLNACTKKFGTLLNSPYIYIYMCVCVCVCVCVMLLYLRTHTYTIHKCTHPPSLSLPLSLPIYIYIYWLTCWNPRKGVPFHLLPYPDVKECATPFQAFLQFNPLSLPINAEC